MLRRFRQFLAGSERGLQFGSEPRSAFGVIAWVVWAGFLLFPLVNAIGQREPTGQHVFSIAAAAVFVACYFALVFEFRFRDTRRWGLPLYGVIVAITIGLTAFDRPGWGFLFTYCAACAAVIPLPRYTLLNLAALTVLSGLVPALGGGNDATSIGFVASTAGIGLLMVLVRDLRLRNEELTSARAELARLAVAEERERFARDLHDLLGHTLSVIALKAELAGRLVSSRPDEASREIAEVERVARGALGEVREAVSGYRQPTLAGELAGARMALSAAGVAVDVVAPDVRLDAGVEAVLAWAVREGATNVIRHSGATRCSLRVAVRLTEASVEVVDDGGGVVAGGESSSGHGLAGLRERAEALGGRVDAGSSPGGGFRLCVRLPVAAAPATPAAPADGGGRGGADVAPAAASQALGP